MAKMESKTFQWFESGFPRLSTNPDLGNTELLIIGKQMEMVGNIPIKAKAVLWLTLCPRSPTRQYLHFLLPES